MKTLGDLQAASQKGEPVDHEAWETCIERIRNLCDQWFVELAEGEYDDAKKAEVSDG